MLKAPCICILFISNIALAYNADDPNLTSSNGLTSGGMSFNNSNPVPGLSDAQATLDFANNNSNSQATVLENSPSIDGYQKKRSSFDGNSWNPIDDGLEGIEQ